MEAPTWGRLERFARDLATIDVNASGAVRPTIYGFAGEAMLAGVELRPHPPGGVHTPLIEALALLVPLGADRLAFLASGRAWSLDDPVPPVCEDGDLRQTVAMLVAIDGHDRLEPEPRSVLLPYSVDDDGVQWGDPVRIDDEPEGTVGGLLSLALTRDLEVCGDTLTVGRQALRLARIGHALQVPPAGADARLAGSILTALESESAGEPQPDWLPAPR